MLGMGKTIWKINMKKLCKILALTILITLPALAQTTYYVSSSEGNDNNSGKSENSPIKTIEKVNSLELKPGDKVLFKRGDVWDESRGIIIKTGGIAGNEIVFGNYGTGSKPVIKLFSEIPGWKNADNWEKTGNNIWRIKVEKYHKKPGIYRIWLDNVQYKRAESIEKYWLTEANNGLSLKPQPRYTFGIDEEYRFFQTGDFLYVYAPENPANYYNSMITNLARNSRRVIYLKDADYVTITGLNLQGGHRTVRAENCDNLKITDCEIGYSTFHGIGIRGGYDAGLISENIEISNCRLNGHWDDLYGGAYDYYSMPYTITASFLTVNIAIGLENGVQNAKVFNNLVRDYHFAAFRIHGTPTHPSKNNEVYDNFCYFDNVVTARLLHVVGYKNPDGKLGYCSNNKVYRNYARNTRLTNEVGGDHNYIFFNIFDRTVDRNPRVYGGSGNGVLFGKGDPQGISKFNYIFNNTIYKAARKPLGGWPQKDCQIFNNLIINSGSGNDNIWLGEGTNRGTVVKNNLIFYSGKGKNDIVCQFAGKGLTIDEFNKADANYNEDFSGNLLYTGNLSDLIANPEQSNFSIIKNSPADGGGIDISKYVPAGFKDMNGKSIDLKKPPIGAIAAGGVTPQITTESNIKVFLEGSYLGNASMDTKLARNNVIPLTQPYSSAPWNYNGNESVPEIKNDIVDWILLELRSDETTVKHREAALLNRNGYIVSVDGSANFNFNNVSEGDYYLVIYHRNHLPVMSAKKIHVDQNGAAEYDFTKDSNATYGGKNAVANFEDGNFGMLAGDSDANGVVNVLDNGAVQSKMFSMGYTSSDTDMNNIVNVLDYTFVSKNLLKTSKVP